jgi:hypothetical protein
MSLLSLVTLAFNVLITAKMNLAGQIAVTGLEVDIIAPTNPLN